MTTVSDVWAYFDSSALAKRYLQETGRRDVMRLLRDYEVVTSAVVRVELRSALRRRAADATLGAAQVAEILRRVAAESGWWALVDVTSDVLAGAETLVAAQPLRALDAIHLASAQLFAGRIGTPDLMFVSADVRQTAAAADAGLTARLVPT